MTFMNLNKSDKNRWKYRALKKIEHQNARTHMSLHGDYLPNRQNKQKNNIARSMIPTTLQSLKRYLKIPWKEWLKYNISKSENSRCLELIKAFDITVIHIEWSGTSDAGS